MNNARLNQLTVTLSILLLALPPQALAGGDGRSVPAVPRHGGPLSGRHHDAACFADGDCPDHAPCLDGACLQRPAITAFTLIDTTHNTPLPWHPPLRNGAVLRADLLPAISIRVETDPPAVGSVVLNLRRKGRRPVHRQMENLAPYALFGDSDASVSPWPAELREPGRYTLRATAHDLADGGGLASEPAVVTFELVTDPCQGDADCDDGVFCNGAESCIAGQCVFGLPACGAQPCNEDTALCGAPPCTSDADCDDGVFCSGEESCVVGTCVAGASPCGDAALCIEAKAACQTTQWRPPVGVPRPRFGIVETAPPYAPSNPLHYYVNNSQPMATDQGNPNGSPLLPRLTIPLELEPGAVVEVRGGPYAYTSMANKLFVTGEGTAEQPIFVRGDPTAAPPVFTKSVFVRGSYMIFEHLRFEERGFDLRPLEGDIHHVGIRHCTFAGSGTKGGGPTVKVIGNPIPIDHIVIYGNVIHDNGDDDPRAPDLGRHGIGVGFNVQHLWIVDNLIHDNGSDSIQVNFHGDFPGKRPARFVYIGRNEMFGDRENAVDLKVCRDIVVSENRMYEYASSMTSNGVALVVHSGQTTPEFEEPEYIWILNNLISDARLGISVTDGREVFIMGNVVQDIHHDEADYDPANVFAGGVGIHARNSGPVHVINNTLNRCDAGISANAELRTANNLISSLSVAGSYHLNVLDASAVEADFDLLFQAGGPAQVLWEGNPYTLEGLQALGHEQHGLEANPRLANPTLDDYHLLPLSPAIDSGRTDIALQTFFNRYGYSIAWDWDGADRVQGPRVDIGADEFPE